MAEIEAQIKTQQFVMGAAAFVKAADYKTIYANQIQIALTPFDFQLSLAQGSVIGGTPVNEVQATVFLSPPEAKVLASLLSKIVADYERQLGTISVPPNLLAPAPDTPSTGT